VARVRRGKEEEGKGLFDGYGMGRGVKGGCGSIVE
jgi:hypothetical protein